jgi:hypothetical protein
VKNTKSHYSYIPLKNSENKLRSEDFIYLRPRSEEERFVPQLLDHNRATVGAPKLS